jgi:hypothetical protein
MHIIIIPAVTVYSQMSPVGNGPSLTVLQAVVFHSAPAVSNIA